MKAGRPKALRCAIYTRVSTEHGLEQEFNSLDNQREAAEAYVKSQAHEGWRLLPARYDDGGFSGASMERPALQQLLADIRSRQIDVVVVYKVDRLTRSLADFAKLVELFDAHAVSFVSVTQAFNTTSSMGRLTLNVLLSFAQFEREVTGERIRDKIAASKAKGMWMGGVVPLGYRVEDRKLLVDPKEAETIRLIFERYIALKSTLRLARELHERGIVTRMRHKADGRQSGGNPFTVGPLRHLLGNRVYLGEITHKGRTYAGEHGAIVARETFEEAQALLAENGKGRNFMRAPSGALLQGRLVNSAGDPMKPTHATNNGVRYRYYVARCLVRGTPAPSAAVLRVPAPEVEAAVISALEADASTSNAPESLAEQVERVVVHTDRLEIFASRDQDAGHDAHPLIAPWKARRRSSHLRVDSLSVPQQSRWADRKVIRAEARARLIQAIAKARVHVARMVHGGDDELAKIAAEEDCTERSVRMNLQLAFLSPLIVAAAINGQLRHGWGLSAAANVNQSWKEQVAALISQR